MRAAWMIGTHRAELCLSLAESRKRLDRPAQRACDDDADSLPRVPNMFRPHFSGAYWVSLAKRRIRGRVGLAHDSTKAFSTAKLFLETFP
jgi:hypothetical protein